MKAIEAKDAESAAGKPALLRLNSSPAPGYIFMTSFSDVP
jgi:hypothetical protein